MAQRAGWFKLIRLHRQLRRRICSAARWMFLNAGANFVENRRRHCINTRRHLLQLCQALPSRSAGRQVADHQKRFLTGRLLRTLIQLCSQVCFFGLRWHRAALVAVHGAMGVWVADL